MAVVAPPFGLWPSWRELGADYRTAKGEQRRVVLPGTAVLDLNTRTSVALRAAGVELISGEAAISLAGASSPFTVAAGGRVMARDAVSNCGTPTAASA